MSIANVTLLDSFDTWRGRTNQLIVLYESSNSSIVSISTAANVTVNVAIGAFRAANNAANVAVLAYNQANIATPAFDKANLAMVQANNTANYANTYSITIGAASNTWANTVSVALYPYANTIGNNSNSVATSIGNAGNSYTIQVGAASNTWANTVSNALYPYSNGVANSANAYALATSITIGAASNTWANSVNTYSNTTYVKIAGGQTITGGFDANSFNAGSNIAAYGTWTPSSANGNYQWVTSNGSVTVAVPGTNTALDILWVNGTGAKTVTMDAGYAAPSGGGGDSYANTAGNKYLLMLRRINSVSTYVWKALQ